jgi:hypothetical protein
MSYTTKSESIDWSKVGGPVVFSGGRGRKGPRYFSAKGKHPGLAGKPFKGSGIFSKPWAAKRVYCVKTYGKKYRNSRGIPKGTRMGCRQYGTWGDYPVRRKQSQGYGRPSAGQMRDIGVAAHQLRIGQGMGASAAMKSAWQLVMGGVRANPRAMKRPYGS